MKVIKLANVPKEPNPSKLFTGPVTSQVVLDTPTLRIRQVNFGKGVRNKFHTHTSDQILIITEGKGIVATEKEEITVVPGDVVLFPAGENHWHGATKNTTFSHIYVTEPGQKTTQNEA